MFEKIWKWPVDIVHHQAGSAGPLAFVGGVGDFDANGKIRHPDNMHDQIAGTVENIASALALEFCTLADIVRLKVFYSSGTSDWDIIASLASHLPTDPLPVISTVPEPLQPFAGQCIQIQVIAQRNWRRLSDIRTVPLAVPGSWASSLDGRQVTAGLRAGEFIAVANRAAVDDGGDLISEEPVEQSHAVMEMHERTLAALGASLQDSVKMEGYYFGATLDEWAPLAQARASHFREPAPPATVVPCHRLYPEGARTKIEVMAMRALWNGFDKYIGREDYWPERVWDWPIPMPYRQAIRLRNMIWLGGQVPHTPFTNVGVRIMPGDLAAQTRFTMTYVEDLLRGFQRRPADLKLMVCYFTSNGQADTDRFLDTVAACVGGALPPMTLVPKPMMHSPENTVEIWGVAQG